MKRMILAIALVATAVLSAVAPDAYAAEQTVEADEVSNEQMVSYYESAMVGKNVWVVDSRPVGEFNAGHIPGAASLPLFILVP